MAKYLQNLNLNKYLTLSRFCRKRYTLIPLLFCILLPNNILLKSLTTDHVVMKRNVTSEPDVTEEYEKCIKTTSRNASNFIYLDKMVTFGPKEYYSLGYIIGSIGGGRHADLRGAKNIYYFYMGWCIVLGFLGLTIRNLKIENLSTTFMTISGIVNGAELCARMNLIAHWIPTGHVTWVVVLLNIASEAIDNNSEYLLEYYGWKRSRMLNNILAIVEILFLLIFHFNVYSSPKLHPFSNEKERDEMLKYVNEFPIPKFPIKHILKEYRLWTLAFCNIADNNWSLGYYGICCVYFFRAVMSMPERHLKRINSFVLIQRHIFAIVIALSIDCVIRKWNISIMYLRTLLIAIGLILPCFLKIYITYTECHFDYAKILYVLTTFFVSGFRVSIDPHTIDITRHYAGTSYALITSSTTFFGIINSFLSPYIFKRHTLYEYRNMMQMMTVICVFAAFLHYNFTKPTLPKWERVWERETKSDLQIVVQSSITSLSRYDEVVGRIFKLFSKIINFIKPVKQNQTNTIDT